MSSRALALRAPRGFCPDPRFGLARHGPSEPEPAPPAEPEPDPLEEAFASGLAEGERRAADAYQAALAGIEGRYRDLAKGFAQMGRDEAEVFKQRLRDLVILLCEASLAPLALDPALLAGRVERAAGLMRRAADERRVRLHPDDLALVQALVPAGLTLEADSSLARGALRIEIEEGGIADGPEQWQQALREALGQT